MGSFVLDFSAYNALLSSNGHSTSYYGTDDAYLGGGDPGLSVAPGRRGGHLNHHLNQHHHHQQQQQQQQGGPYNPGQNAYPRHQISNRYIVYDRNSLPRLEAEKTYQDRRKQHIANFGSTWLKPPGVAKTLFQIREECREQEEQAEAERREELAQQLAQAEAAALDGGDGTALEDGGAGEGGDLTGDPAGMTELMGVDGDDAAAAVASMEADMMDEDGELDLDNEVPDADAEDFSFGNNDDGDDPFASSSGDEDDEEEDEDDEDDEGDGGGRPRIHVENDNGNESIAAGSGAGAGIADLSQDDAEADPPQHYTHGSSQQQARQGVYVSTPAAAAMTADTPVRSLEEQHAQAQARAAERREMRQMRAAEDRMRAMRAHPRLSGVGLSMGMGLYGDEDDLDEEDQEQMLQEDDLVREMSSPGAAASHHRQPQQQRQRRRHLRTEDNNNNNNIARGHANSSSFIDDHIHQDNDAGFEQDGDDGGVSGLEMDVDADLDGDDNGAMDLSAFGDGGYEHTDTEAELSSSVVGGGDDDHGDGHLPHQSFLALAGAASGSSSMAAPRSSGVGMGGMGHGHISGVTASGNRHRQQYRGSLTRSDRNSMDISSLLSQDGSSTFGSSPQVRRL
ncbi:uncharacterized protein SPSK_08834 [Sporothrix schenckii 1099-18]|uniref:Uncharacterized protein n=2 Tax=Sporothrix schenckii TaxID=29908 RepID=U7PWQ0_SPOS1|nr:uncharacterized protein SPSK_08834 [Sporothrix schenckii 1099-18]ERT00013.1 hypothetical protein HMPREF1624_03382 [Sporothrix schenckii ATCC 58251]KJR85564.1 hypothetical protein SPSK_08834 [Sporothrix schenckii 1099-18]